MEHNGKKYFFGTSGSFPIYYPKTVSPKSISATDWMVCIFSFSQGKSKRVWRKKIPAIFASLFRFPQTGNLVFGIGKEMKLLFRFNAVATALLLFMLREKGGGGGRTNSCFPKIANPKFPLKFACRLLLLFPFSHSRPN